MRNEFVKQKMNENGWMFSFKKERQRIGNGKQNKKKVKKFMIHSIPFHFISNGHYDDYDDGYGYQLFRLIFVSLFVPQRERV